MIKIILKTYRFFLITICISIFSISTFAGNKPKKMAMPIAHVDVYKIEQPKNKQIILTYPARLKSTNSITIVARVSGILLKKFYTEGRYVKKGDLLYKIEPTLYKAKVNVAMAMLEKARANLHKTENEWMRYKILYKKKVISQQKMDDITNLYQSSKATLNEAKANLKLAKTNLNYTSVRATISGITGLKLIDVGDYVKIGDKLVTITKIKPIYAEFSFTDTDMLKIKNDIMHKRIIKRAKLTAYIIQNRKKYVGYVDFIDTSIDTKTSTIKARAIFNNKNGNLMPGEFVRIHIYGYIRKNVITIPQTALIQNSMGKMVFLVVHGKIVPKFVNVSLGPNNTFIVNKGLKPGELVVVDNFFKIRPNAPVKIDRIINNTK